MIYFDSYLDEVSSLSRYFPPLFLLPIAFASHPQPAGPGRSPLCDPMAAGPAPKNNKIKEMVNKKGQQSSGTSSQKRTETHPRAVLAWVVCVENMQAVARVGVSSNNISRGRQQPYDVGSRQRPLSCSCPLFAADSMSKEWQAGARCWLFLLFCILLSSFWVSMASFAVALLPV